MLNYGVFGNIMIFLLFILAIVVLLTLVHELGHFAVAKISKTTVSELAIGFGPAIVQWGKTTKYTLRLFPVGGYVAVLSDDLLQIINYAKSKPLSPNDIAVVNKEIKPFTLTQFDYTDAKTLDSNSTWKKMVFAMMGIGFNLIFMVSIMWIGAGTVGVPVSDGKIYVPLTIDQDGVIQNFVEINQVTFYSTADAIEKEFFTSTNTDGTVNLNFYTEVANQFISSEIGTTAQLSYVVDGALAKTVYISYDYHQDTIDSVSGDVITPAGNYWTVNETFWSNENFGSSWTSEEGMTEGIHSLDGRVLTTEDLTGNSNDKSFLFESYSLSTENAFAQAWTQTGYMIANAYCLMFTFGTVQVSTVDPSHSTMIDSPTSQYSWLIVFWYIGILSAILIAFNLIPIPPLDGYKTLQWGIEGAIGRKMDPMTEATVNKVGWWTIIGVTVIVVVGPMLMLI